MTLGYPKGSHRRSFPFSAHAFSEPEAFSVRSENVGMMGQPVQQGPGQLPAAKHMWPLREVQGGRHEERLPLIPLSHYLEEELGSIMVRLSVVVLSAPGLHR